MIDGFDRDELSLPAAKVIAYASQEHETFTNGCNTSSKGKTELDKSSVVEATSERPTMRGQYEACQNFTAINFRQKLVVPEIWFEVFL